MRAANSKHFGLTSELGISIAVLAASIVVSVAPSFYPNLFLYVPPTLYAAYRYGHRYALATAGASVSIVLAGICVRDAFSTNPAISFGAENWGDIIWWALLLVAGCAWLASVLFGKFRNRNNEYASVLRQVLAHDESRYEQVKKVAAFAELIAMEMALPPDRVALARSAALLQGLTDVNASRETLGSLANVCVEHDGTESGLGAALNIAIAERLNGSQWNKLPIESRIIAVANTFEELTSPKTRRSGLPLRVVRNMIAREADRRFDPTVVKALLRLCDRGDLQSEAQTRQTAPVA